MNLGIIIVNHGASIKDEQKKAIGSLEEEIKDKYRDVFVKSFMASDKIRKKYKDKAQCLEGILNDFKDKNIKNVKFLMTYVVRGIEYKKVFLKAKGLNKDNFFDFSFTPALLEEDLEEIVSFVKELSENNYSLIIGHGSPKVGLDQFKRFKEKLEGSFSNLFLSTLEDRNYDRLINKFKEENIKNIKIIPFFIVAGNHVYKDIESKKDSYKVILEENGIRVDLDKKSLILYNQIRDLFIEKLAKAWQNQGFIVLLIGMKKSFT